MAQTKAIVDKLLTSVSSAYIPEGYLAESILTPLKVKQSSGKLAKYGMNHLRIEVSVTGGRGAYRRVEPITRTSTSYQIENHGLEGLVTADDYRNVEQPFDAEKDESLGVTTMLALEKEKALADVLSSTSIMTLNQTLSGTAQLNDYTNSDPLAKFMAAQAAVYNGCGFAPDTAIMSWAVANTLRYSPKILEALGYSYTRAGQLTNDDLANVMGVKRLLIGTAMHNSAKEGQTDVLSPIWGKNIIFAVAPSAAVPYQTSLGYHVGFSDKGGRQVYKYEVNNPPGSNAVLVEDCYDMLIANASAGYLIKDAIA